MKLKLNKKAKNILFIILILVIAIGGFFLAKTFMPQNNSSEDNNSNAKSNPTFKEETEDSLTFKDNLEFSLNAKIPTLNDLVTQEDVEATLKIYLNDEEYTKETLSDFGTYKIVITYKDQEYSKEFTIQDTEAPVLTLQEVSIKENTKYTINNFIKSCTDNSNQECTYEFTKTEMGKYTKEGTYEIEIKAQDSNGNETTSKTKLTIKKAETTPQPETSKPQTSTETKPTETTPTETKPEETQTITEDQTTETTKYGVKVTMIETVTYKVAADGTKTEVSRKTKNTKYDKSGFKATSNDLKAEATANSKTYASKINEVLKYVNEYRSAVSTSNISLDNDLTIAANIRALEMAWSGKVEHARPGSNDNQSCFTVFSDLGIRDRFYTMGENIAAGYSTPAAVSTGWRNSPGHYQNMINANFKHIGIGVAYLEGRYYWVQVFGN